LKNDKHLGWKIESADMEKVKFKSEEKKLRQLARQLYNEEEYFEALKTYQQIIDICPYDAESTYQLLDCYFDLGLSPHTASKYNLDEQGNLKKNEKWVHINPRDMVGENEAENLILKKTYELETSISTLHENLVNNPDDTKARLTLAVCYEYWMDFQEAIEIYEELTLPDMNIELRLSGTKRLIQCYKGTGNDSEVVKSIKLLEEISDQEDSEVYYEKAILANKLDDFQESQNLVLRYEKSTYAGIVQSEIGYKVLLLKLNNLIGLNNADKANKLIHSFFDILLRKSKIFHTDLEAILQVGVVLESLKDFDYIMQLLNNNMIKNNPVLSLFFHQYTCSAAKANGDHIGLYAALVKLKQNIFDSLKGKHVDISEYWIYYKKTSQVDFNPTTSDQSINEYVESNLSDLKNTLKDSTDKRVLQINNDLTELEAKIKAEHEEDEKNMLVKLTTADDKIDFECKVMGYQFPEITDTYDSNWINLNVKFKGDGKSINETMGFLEYWDLDSIYKWFGALSKRRLPFTVYLGFLEPDISFRYIGYDNDSVTINIELRWHLDPNFDSYDEINAESVFILQFKLDDDDFNNILKAFGVARRKYGSGIRISPLGNS